MSGQPRHQTKSLLQSPSTAPQSGILQRKCASCGNHTVAGAKCVDCVKNKVGGQEGLNGVPPIVHEILNTSGEPLDKTTRAFMEPRFGKNFAHVPINLSAAPAAPNLKIGRTDDRLETEADNASEKIFRQSKTLNDDQKIDFGHVRIHTGTQAAQAAQAVNARAFTVGRHIVFNKGEYQPHFNAGRQLIAHELAHIIQQSGNLSPSTLRRQPKPPGASTVASAWFKVAISRQMDSTQLLSEFVSQYCTSKSTVQTDVTSCRNRGWHWSSGGGEIIITAEDVKKGYKLLQVEDRLLTSQDDKTRQENRKEFGTFGAPEQAEIHEETDRQFWEKTQYKVGTTLGASPDDKKMAQYWMAIRDELLSQRKSLHSLPPELQKFLFDEHALASVEPKDYETVLNIVSKVSALSQAELDEYKSRVTARTTDWKAYETAVDRFIAERKERETTAKEKQTIETRLFGLDALYDRYQLYLSLLKNNVALAGLGRTSPGALGTALGTQSTINSERTALEADLIKAGFPGGIADFQKFIDDYEQVFEKETLAVAKVMLDQYEHQLWTEEQRYQKSGEADALYQSVSTSGAKAEYDEANKIRDDHAQMPMTPDEMAEQSYWVGQRNQALGRGESKVRTAAASHPLVSNADFNRETLTRAPQNQVQSIMLDYITARRKDIAATRKSLKDKPTMIYGLKTLLESSFRVQNIQSGTIHDKIIRNHITDVKWSEAVPEIVLGVIAIAAGLLSAGTGTVAVLAGGAAFGIGAYQAYEEWQRYERNMAAYGAKMTPESPSMAWVIIAVIGAGIDAAVFASALSKVPKLRLAIDAFNAGPEADDVVKLADKLDQLPDVEESIRRSIIRAAGAEVDARKGWRAIFKPMGAAMMVLLPGALEFGKFVYAVYLSVRRGFRELQAFSKLKEATDLFGDLSKLPIDELALLKTGFLKAIEEVETVAARAKLLEIVESDINVFMKLRAETPGMTVEQLLTKIDAWDAATKAGKFKWGNAASKPTYGHTFLDHTRKLKPSQLSDRARSLGHQVGQWTNDEEAARLIADVAKRGPGAHDVRIPASMGRSFLADGTELTTDMARIVVKPDGSVRTAFPYSSAHPTSAP